MRSGGTPTMRSRGAPKILRRRERARPVPAVRREMRSAAPEVDGGRPPLLFVPGFGAGAWVFEEHWLDHAAGRGFAAYAMSVRGHGDSGAVPRATVRAYVHDVVQVAAGLPRRAVLIGHGAGALVVARALARYPARAAVLAAPVFGGPAMVARALVRNPCEHATSRGTGGSGAARRTSGCGSRRGRQIGRAHV